jgi:hypothetical protein
MHLDHRDDKVRERKAGEFSVLYGMGAHHKEKILEGIRELEDEHDEEAKN